MAEQIYKIPGRKHFFSDGSVKALQEVPLLLPNPKSSTDTSKIQIQDWMQNAQIQDKQIGIKRSMIPCLPISILDGEDSEKCFNLAKAIGETAELKIIPENHNQACWFLILKYYRQALGVALAQKLYPRCLYNPFHPLDVLLNPKSKYFEYILDSLELDSGCRQQIANSLELEPNCIERLLDSSELNSDSLEKLLEYLQLDLECRDQFLVSVEKFRSRGIFCRYLPYPSVRNLIRSAETNLARYRLIETGFSLIKTKAEAEKRCFAFNNPSELFLEVLKEEFETGWFLGPLDTDHQWQTKHIQRENIRARIRILKDQDWYNDSQVESQSELRPRKLSYDEAKKQYLDYLKESDWSGYWLYVLYEQNISHVNSQVDSLWTNYLDAFSKGQKTFIHDLDWRNGEAYKSYTTSKSRRVNAQFDGQGYIHWVWA